jgi:putative serine protease PepD
MTDTTHHDKLRSDGWTTPFDAGAPPGHDDPMRHQAAQHRWIATVVAIVVTAVLASLLTAGFIAAVDHTTTRTAAASPVAPVVANGSTPDWVAVAAAVEPSVVAVRVDTAAGGDEGSGVILDTSGRILTNDHVIAGATTHGITVALADGRIYPATVVGADTSTDLAVVHLTDPPTGLKPAAFGDSGTLKVGDPVMAAGNPLGLSDTVTTGIVSALNRPVVTTPDTTQQNPFGSGGTGSSAQPIVTNAIQTDAAVNPGNSGGALVNTSGQVVGITSSIASLDTTGGAQSGSIGLGFAIGSNEAKNIADQIIANGTVQHAYLGVTFTDGTATVDGTSRNAAIIAAVTAGSPAAKAGLQAKDAIVAINGQPLDDADSLIAQVRAMNPGATVSLTVATGGTTHTVSIALAAQPATAR